MNDAEIEDNHYTWWPIPLVDGGHWKITGTWSTHQRLGLVIESVQLESIEDAPINSAALRFLRIDSLRAAVNRAISPVYPWGD